MTHAVMKFAIIVRRQENVSRGIRANVSKKSRNRIVLKKEQSLKRGI